jgi:hypothetical protein
MSLIDLSGYTDKGSTLKNDVRLMNDHYLKSNNGVYKLVLKKDCNLITYKDDKTQVWESETGGNEDGCSLLNQKDGNIVLYDVNNKAVWSTTTKGDKKLKLVLQDNGTLGVFTEDDSPVWNDKDFLNAGYKKKGNSLKINEKLSTKEYLESPNKEYSLDNNNCNLSLKKKGKQIWESKTLNKGEECNLLYEENGDIVLYDSKDSSVWSTNTGDLGVTSFNVSNNGKIEAFYGDSLIWDNENLPKAALDAKNIDPLNLGGNDDTTKTPKKATSVKNEPSNKSLAERIKDLKKKNGIKDKAEVIVPPEPVKGNTMLYIGIGVSIFIIMMIIGGILMSKIPEEIVQ